MNEWFASLQPRERAILVTGSVATLIILLWALVWNPVNTGYGYASQDVENKQALLAEGRRLAASRPTRNAGNTGSRPSAGSNQSLTLLVANSINANGLNRAYRSSTPAADDSIRVSLQDAPFDEVVVWLGQLSNNNGIVVTASNFSRRSESGRVDASIVLQRQ